jgi:hypothetical protein
MLIAILRYSYQQCTKKAIAGKISTFVDRHYIRIGVSNRIHLYNTTPERHKPLTTKDAPLDCRDLMG